jgi:hypothetical protein
VPAPRPPEKREDVAKASLAKAIESETRAPTDFEASATLYEQALWDAKETPVHPEAKRRMEALRARQRQAYVDELSPLAEQVRGLLDKEQFGAAIEALETAKLRKAAPPWKALLDERLEEVRTRTARAFLPLKEKALEARKQGKADDIKALSAKVAAWGLPSIAKELEEALAAAAPTVAAPAPDTSAAAEAFRSAWTAAMLPCAGRDFAEAAKAMDAAAAALKEADLRAEATGDAELLRRTSALLTEAMELLAKWPKGKELAFAYWDPTGVRRELKGPVARAEACRVSIQKEKETVTVELGEILASSLADLLSRRAGRNLAADGPALALLCLAEGEVDAARKIAPSLPAKFWTLGEGFRASPDPAALQSEGDARSLFYSAQSDAATFVSQAQGVLKARSLLADFGKTRFVRRNRASINARAEEARDYVFLAEDLSSAGTFKLTRAKTGMIWLSDADSDSAQRKNNFIDLDFSALPDLRYRCWVYVGGCCAETLAFGLQGSEMKGAEAGATDGVVAEPGGDAVLPVKHSIAASTKTHASHGGRKQPSHWGWVEIALPAYGTAGAKKVRIVTDQQGFSVGAAVVSATRKAAPMESEIRDLERVRTTRVAVVPGVLTGSVDKAEGGYDLSHQGPLDWAYWGRGGVITNFDHKAGAGLISAVSQIGRGNDSGTYSHDSRTVAWNDGTPTRTGLAEHSYLWSRGALNSGLAFTCQATTTNRTLLIYCGASNASATLSATLSDNSAPKCMVTYAGPGAFLVGLTFRSGSANQQLRVTLLKTGNNPGFTDGSVDLMAAMLR